MRMLPSYYSFLKTNFHHSLLPRFLGLYTLRRRRTVRVEGASSAAPPERILVMNNVFYHPSPSPIISEIYDLKGSTNHRYVTPKEI